MTVHKIYHRIGTLQAARRSPGGGAFDGGRVFGREVAILDWYPLPIPVVRGGPKAYSAGAWSVPGNGSFGKL